MSIRRNIKAWYNKTFHRKEWEALIQDVSFQAKDGKYSGHFTLQDERLKILSGMIVGTFQASAGINYVEWTVADPASLESYTLTIQKTSRPTPGIVNGRLRDALLQIANIPKEDWSFPSHPVRVRQLAVMALRDMGYLPDEDEQEEDSVIRCPSCQGGAWSTLKSCSEPEGLRPDMECAGCGTLYAVSKSGLLPLNR